MSNYSANKIKDDPNHVWNKILKYIPEGSRILDIGCSSGTLGEYLIHERKCLVDGVEPDKGDYEIAKTRLNKVWNSDIESALDSIDTNYDILIFADVLEHIVYPDKVLIAVKKLLNKNGKVVFSVPNMAHISTRLGLIEGSFKYTETGILDKTHLHFWDKDTVEDVFKNSGMRLIDLDAVIYKYPKKLIDKRLKEMGLRADDKAIEMLTSMGASAFQYVGQAEYSSLKQEKIVLPKELLAEDIQKLVDKDLISQQETIDKFYKQSVEDRKYVKSLEATLKNQQETLSSQQTTIKNQQETIKNLENIFNEMKKTLAYKIFRGLKKIKQKVVK